MRNAQNDFIASTAPPVFGVAVNRTTAQEPLPPPISRNAVYRNDAIGVYLQKSLPQTQIIEDQYLSDAFGFTLVDPAGRMLLRVTWRHRDTPAQMEQRIRELVQDSATPDLRPQPVRIGSYQGVMVTGAPGIDPSTYVYLAAYGRLYEIVCPEREGVTACETLFQAISFGPAAGAPEGLGLKRIEDVLHENPPYLEAPLLKGPGSESPELSW